MEAVLELAEQVLAAASGGRGDLEAYVEHRLVTTVEAGAGATLRYVGRADLRGVGVRAVVHDQVGYASTADVSDDGLRAVVSLARANMEVSDGDPAGARLPAPSPSEPVDGLCVGALSALTLASKLSMVTDLSRRVTSLDRRVRRLDTARWRDEHRLVAVASTRGVSTAYESAFAELSCDVLGGDDHADATDYAYWWGRDPGAIDVEALAEDAVRRVVRLLGPATTLRHADSIVLDPEISGLLMDAAGRALTGGALGNRRSPFTDRLGEPVAADFLRLVDDGIYPGAPGAAPIDDEGVPHRRTRLIEEGVLVGALHSTATAASVGEDASTGNARRSSHRAAPRAGATALRLSPTDVPQPAVGDAVYVQQVSGGATGISAVTGRVSVGGMGFAMRDGEPAGRLPTIPIATSLQALLRELVSVAADARVLPDLPVLAPTLVWQPPSRLAW
jgi:PmbA protein